MATWIVHLRIADVFIKQGIIPDEYKTEFVLGSLAPDCGYGKKDSFGDFSPPPSVTHWTPNGCKVFCEYTKFYDTYLRNKERNSDYYFYLGYYTHLLTDVLWSMSIYMPTRYKYAEEYRNNPEYLNIIKKDWYTNDFLFLSKAPNFEPYELLRNARDIKDYLPYYEPGQLATQLKFIADYYNDKSNYDKNHIFKYLSENEITEFINIASDLIKKSLS